MKLPGLRGWPTLLLCYHTHLVPCCYLLKHIRRAQLMKYFVICRATDTTFLQRQIDRQEALVDERGHTVTKNALYFPSTPTNTHTITLPLNPTPTPLPPPPPPVFYNPVAVPSAACGTLGSGQQLVGMGCAVQWQWCSSYLITPQLSAML